MWSCTSPAANTPSTEVRVESALGDDVALVVEVELAGEERGVGVVADGDEEPVDREVAERRR